MEREKVKERWTGYCSELYEITDMPGKESFLKELSEMTPPPSDNTDDSILWEEVMDAVKRLKRNKSPGNDGITVEMIKTG